MTQFALCVAGLVLLVYAFFKWATKNNLYFADRNLPYLKPSFLFGSTGPFLTGQNNINEYMDKLYNSFPNERWFGMFDFRAPVYFLRHPETIKQIIVKDFDHFEDHRPFIDATIDDMFGNSLLMLRGEKWRDMRATLSPAFTGSKMRQMFELVRDCAASMSAEFKQRSDNGENQIRVEMKELFCRYTTDVIATSAFGICVNSFKDTENEFLLMGKKMTNFRNVRSVIKIFLIQVCPWAMRKLKIQFIDGGAGRFFRNMVLQNINSRVEQGIFRPDLINLLMQLKTEHTISNDSSEPQSFDKDSAGFATVAESTIGTKLVKRAWSDDEIAAQCFLFFVAGFDTSSTCLSFFAYELALNPEVQHRLYEECVQTKEQLGADGQLTYDVLQKMKYMDQVVSEVLRLWPPLMATDRYCGKDYEFQDGDRKVQIKKGNGVWIPIYSVMHDPMYYPEPNKFDPDRFRDENKSNIVPGTYIPFGVGPRNCIGSRFALMEVKAVIYYLLLNFSFAPNEKTQIPIQVSMGPTGLVAQRGFDLDLKPRQ